MGVNFNSNNGPLRPAASIFNAGRGSATDAVDALFLNPSPASRNERAARRVQGEVIDIKVDDKDTRQNDDARIRRQAENAKILALTLPGTGSLATNKPKDPIKELNQRVSALEEQIADLRNLIGGKKSNDNATIYPNAKPAELKPNPDAVYQLANSQYSSFIPNKQNVRSIAENV